jgi:hypothetical protein
MRHLVFFGIKGITKTGARIGKMEGAVKKEKNPNQPFLPQAPFGGH